MDNNEIQKANHKALPKYILVLVISGIVGGVVGFFSARCGLNTLSESLKNVGVMFGMYIAPWLMLALAVIVPVIAIPKYKRAKGMLNTWDGENEEVSDQVEEKLSVVIWLTGAAIIISYFLIAAVYAEGFEIFENNSILTFFMSVAAFLAVLIEVILIQQKCVDAAKRTNPEKTVSIYDMKFQKKWVDSCDEAEKILIGKCAFKSYTATNMVCTILSMALAIGALVFGIGFLPSLSVCIVWIVNQSVYCKEALKYSKAGTKIS